MARDERRIRVNRAPRTSGAEASSGLPELFRELGRTAGGLIDLKTGEVANERQRQAIVASEQLTFERDSEGNVIAPSFEEPGFFGPSIFDAQFRENALIRYQQEVLQQSNTRLGEIANKYLQVPEGVIPNWEGFNEEANAYLEETMRSVLPDVRGSVTDKLEITRNQYSNRIHALQTATINIENKRVFLESMQDQVTDAAQSMAATEAGFDFALYDISSINELIELGVNRHYGEADAEELRDSIGVDLTYGMLMSKARSLGFRPNMTPEELAQVEALGEQMVADIENGNGRAYISRGDRLQFGRMSSLDADTRASMAESFRAYLSTLARVPTAVQAALEAEDAQTLRFNLMRINRFLNAGEVPPTEIIQGLGNGLRTDAARSSASQITQEIYGAQTRLTVTRDWVAKQDADTQYPQWVQDEIDKIVGNAEYNPFTKQGLIRNVLMQLDGKTSSKTISKPRQRFMEAKLQALAHAESEKARAMSAAKNAGMSDAEIERIGRETQVYAYNNYKLMPADEAQTKTLMRELDADAHEVAQKLYGMPMAAYSQMDGQQIEELVMHLEMPPANLLDWVVNMATQPMANPEQAAKAATVYQHLTSAENRDSTFRQAIGQYLGSDRFLAMRRYFTPGLDFSDPTWNVTLTAAINGEALPDAFSADMRNNLNMMVNDYLIDWLDNAYVHQANPMRGNAVFQAPLLREFFQFAGIDQDRAPLIVMNDDMRAMLVTAVASELMNMPDALDDEDDMEIVIANAWAKLLGAGWSISATSVKDDLRGIGGVSVTRFALESFVPPKDLRSAYTSVQNHVSRYYAENRELAPIGNTDHGLYQMDAVRLGLEYKLMPADITGQFPTYHVVMIGKGEAGGRLLRHPLTKVPLEITPDIYQAGIGDMQKMEFVQVRNRAEQIERQRQATSRRHELMRDVRRNRDER